MQQYVVNGIFLGTFYPGDAQKAVLGTLGGMGRDKGPLTLPAHQNIFRRECIDGFADGALAYFKTTGKIELARYRLARAPFTQSQALGDQHFDLAIKRGKTG